MIDTRQIKPGLVALYDIRPGNGVGPFLQPRSPHGAIEAKDDGGGGDNWTIGAIRSCKAPVKSSPPTNQHPVFVTGPMPFLSPNQQCQSTEGKISHSMDLLTPASSPGGLPTLSLTTNSSWLPWGRVAMPLISPVMPVPQKTQCNEGKIFTLCASCGEVYCNWSCLWVCLFVGGSVTMITRNCMHRSSPNWVCR